MQYSKTTKSKSLRICSGVDPEILKGGCTKFSGFELPYSGFDPFWNLWLLPPYGSLSSIQEYNLALDYMETVTHRMKQYLIVFVKNKMFEVLHNA